MSATSSDSSSQSEGRGDALQNGGVEPSPISNELTTLRRRVAELEQQLNSMLRSNEQFRSAGAKLWQIVDFALHAIVVITGDGRICQVNRRAEKLFGYVAGELVGELVEVLIPEASRKRHPQQRDSYMAAPTVRPMGAGRDLFGRRKDGTEVPVEIGLTPIQTEQGLMVIASILDISQRKRAEDRFRLVVESSPNAFVMVGRTGEIVLVNLQTERMFGYKRNELVGQSIEVLVPDPYKKTHPIERQHFFVEPVTRAMGAGRDLRGRRQDGTEFPVEVGLTPIETDEGIYVLSAIVDISERVQADKRRRLHLTELAHAARLSAVGEMFSELAHEINQPLAATANYTRACVRLLKAGEGFDPAQFQEWLEKAAAQAVRATEIVQRIGSFVRRSGPIQADLDINEVIEHVICLPVLDVWQAGVVQRITPTLRLATELPGVKADQVQIEQVLLNLIRNAMDAMADRPLDERRIMIQSYREDKHVCIVVEDNGTGLTPENAAKVFTPFYTTKANGMGLGLSISKSIIEAHSGTLSVESRLGQWTRFTFTLPITRLEANP